MTFDVPEGLDHEFDELVDGMRQIGFVKRVQDDPGFAWKRMNCMRAELFDFERSRWDFDWTKLPVTSAPPIPKPMRIGEIHNADLRISATLRGAAEMSLPEVAKDVELSERTTLAHVGHVRTRGFLMGYHINWMKSNQVIASGRFLGAPHKYLMSGVVVRGITPDEERRIREGLNRLPFLWSEMGGTNYFAELFIPIELSNEVLNFIDEILRGVSAKSRFYIADWGSALSLSTAGDLYDERRRRWTFDVKSQIEALEQEMAKVSLVPR